MFIKTKNRVNYNGFVVDKGKNWFLLDNKRKVKVWNQIDSLICKHLRKNDKIEIVFHKKKNTFHISKVFHQNTKGIWYKKDIFCHRCKTNDCNRHESLDKHEIILYSWTITILSFVWFFLVIGS
jgi:hypothetical protein